METLESWRERRGWAGIYECWFLCVIVGSVCVFVYKTQTIEAEEMEEKWKKQGRHIDRDSEMNKGVTDRNALKAPVTFGIEDAQ